ncbi:hypothetical protein BGW39_008012 [Mortierella sp. 14UC]|nr:hypothetical protein BGW39_008012 [Mortierella sp. 14UC]
MISCATPRKGLFRNHFLNSNQAFRDYLENRPADPDLIFWGARFDILAEDAGRELRRDLTWALCADAKQIKSMVLPLYDIDRYLSAVPWFQALSDVVFLLDSQYKPGNMSSSEEEGVRRFQQSKRTQYMEKMILFIQELQQVHGPVIKSVQYSGSNEDDDLPPEFRQQLFQLLGALKDPLFLDAGNWEHFLAKFQETNLSLVQIICPDLDVRDDAVMDRLIKLGPYLHRCRSLDSFIMDSASDDMFQWAVDERRIYDAKVAAGRTPQTSLVPLREFNVVYYHKTFGRQLNDVVFAFDKTLEIITASCYWVPKNANKQQDLPEFIVGNSFASWDLPRLRKLTLSINCYSILLRIASDLLSRLPRLTHLVLTDKRRQYKRSEIVYWYAASVPDLVVLQLEGTSAISFNPETFGSTRNLVCMELRMVETELGSFPHVPPAEVFEECFAAPAHEMTTTTKTEPTKPTTPPTKTTAPISFTRRPMWTWDWELPKLTSLFLNAEFAYLFQFRMLAGTPNLKDFLVDSRTYTRRHPRTIVLSDFLVHGFDHPTLAAVQEKERRFQEMYASENDSKYDNVGMGEFSARNNYFAQEWKAKDEEEDDDTLEEEDVQDWFNYEYIELPALESFTLRADTALADLLHLIHVVLRSVPKDRVSPLLKAAYLDNDNQPAAAPEGEGQSNAEAAALSNDSDPPQIPYYTFLTSLDFQYFSPPNQGIFDNPTLGSNAYLNNELGHDGYSKWYLAEDIYVRLMHKLQEKAVAHGTARELCNDLTWALSTNTENIRTLVVGLSDVSRYLEQVHRFKVLTDVTFLIDRNLTFSLPFGGELSAQDEEMLSLQRTGRIQHYEEMLSFVQEHRRVHSDVLRIARCISDSVTSESCSMEYQNRLFQCLPLLVRPLSIDNNIWACFVAKIQDTDLSFVEAFFQRIPSGPTDTLWNQLAKEAPFLHRCHALETFDSVSLGDNAFQWAVDERKQFVADLVAGRSCLRPLVPLRDFTISYHHPTAGRQLNDALYAFNDTLEVVSATTTSWSSIEDDIQESPKFSIGGDIDNSSNSFWGLPRLMTLCINTFDTHLRVHPDFISRCPQLKSVDLHDRRREYLLNEVVLETSGLAGRHLNLTGTFALSFHLDTLKTTPELLSLLLGLVTYDVFMFIPPVEEFGAIVGYQEQQQQQHGDEEAVERDDIDLDNSNNSLTIPLGTPSLVALYLDTTTASMEHKRTICLEELLRPSSRHAGLDKFLEKERRRRARIARMIHILDSDQFSDNLGKGAEEIEEDADEQGKGEVESEIWRDFEYVEVPTLTHFTVNGPWTLEGGRALEVLFGKVVPNTMMLTTKDCGGYNLLDVVETTSKCLHDVRTVNVSVCAPMSEAVRAGLERVPESQDRYLPLFQLVQPPEGGRLGSLLSSTFLLRSRRGKLGQQTPFQV